MLKIILFAPGILLTFMQAANADIANLFLVTYGSKTEVTSCDLREAKGAAINEKKPRIYKGQSYGNSCSVKIAKSEFKKEYSFCYLSGVTVTGVGKTKSYSCNVGEVKGTWSFEGYIFNEKVSHESPHTPRTLICKYICMNKHDL